MIELSALGVAILVSIFVLLVYWGVLAFLAMFFQYLGRE